MSKLKKSGIDLQGNDDLIGFLEKKLETYEKNLQQRQNEHEKLLAEHYDLQEKFNQTK